MAAQQAEMEDIISSIRTTLAEETAKVNETKPETADDVLELSADEMVPVEASAAPTLLEDDDLVDIAAFAGTGESKPVDKAVVAAADLLGEYAPAAAPAPVVPVTPLPEPVVAAPKPATEDSDEFDQLLAQISEDQKKHVAAAEEQKKALMAAEEPLGALPVMPEPGILPLEEPVDTVMAASVPLKTNGTTLHVMPGSDGMTVALPAEVLAMALRPMVQDWLQENLAGVVEKLVKAELDKLNQA